MPFLVAGDPDFETSVAVAKHIAPFADLLEIGFPYSDPLADGPTIQAADQRALTNGMNTDCAFALIKLLRETSAIPITVLVYANLVERRGIGRFYRDAKRAGVDGVLIPDVPIEEIRPYRVAARKNNVAPILLVAPTTTNERLAKILLYAEGYLYLVSVLGVTGAREKLLPETLGLIKRVRAKTRLPLAVGFGISKREHVRAVKEAGVDGFIVGSALIKIIEANLGKPRAILLGALSRYLGELNA